MKKRYLVNVRQSGIGLIELLVSMFIGLFIMAGVVQMVGTTSQNAVATNGISRIQENTRYALSRMEDDLHRAGNMGCFSTSLNAQYLQSVGRDIRNTTPEKRAVLNFLESGSDANGKNDYTSMIGGNDDHPSASSLGAEGTDSLTVRFVDQSARMPVQDIGSGTLTLAASASPSATDAFASLEDYKVLVLADCTRSAIFMMSGSSGSYASGATVTWDTVQAPNSGVNATQKNSSEDLEFFGSPLEPDSLMFLYAGSTGAYRYYIDTSAFGSAQGEECETATPQYCALFRAGDGTGEELVDGVHDLQVEYGFLTASDNLRFTDASEINGLADADRAWNTVDRVKITLSLNSVESVPTSSDVDTNIIAKEITRTIALFNQL